MGGFMRVMHGLYGTARDSDALPFHPLRLVEKEMLRFPA